MELENHLESIGPRETGANEWRIFGPPGCGKTTHTARQIERAVAKYGPESVLVTSFSRAAAAELVGRSLPIERQQVGTLHAHCYRALGRPPIAETKVSDWNEHRPAWAITGSTESGLDEPTEERSKGDGSRNGDQLLMDANRWRNRKVPFELWPNADTRFFYAEFEKWKHANGLLDFTDMLETAERDIKIAPGNPSVIFGDEAQDFTRLQLNIVRRWGSHAQYFLVVGDDDQTIYLFTGATPECFLESGLPENQKVILSQSYRVPQAVHRLATGWIQQVARREPKEYRPTADAGEVIRTPYTLEKDPEILIDAVEREIADGRTTVMLLASCSYMLLGVRAELIKRAIPFHNPYRRRRGDWNPLYPGKGVSAADRVLAFAKPHPRAEDVPWTAEDCHKFSEWLEASGTFRRGMKAVAMAGRGDETITLETLQEWLEPDAYEELMKGIMSQSLPEYLQWWIFRVLEAKKKTAGYPIQIAMKRGLGVLRQRPQVIIGTIHSVKGGEADTVFLSPQISYRASEVSKQYIEERDAITRQFYVGMTRARHRLVICGASSEASVDL